MEQTSAAFGRAGASCGADAPPIRYYVTNVGWRYAEAIPLYNQTEATFYLDRSGSKNAVIAPEALVADASENGVLSQFPPAYSEVTAIDGAALVFNSATLFYFFPNEITGYPAARLSVSAQRAGTVALKLEAVQENGASLLLAAGNAAAAAGEQTLSVTLRRAYDNGEDSHDFVAYQWPARQGGAVRLRVEAEAGMGLTLRLGDGASRLTVPFTDDDETGYCGKVTVGGRTFDGTMYWLQDRVYLNYTKASLCDSWLSCPADSPYTVDAQGAAVFEAFTFLPESAGLKNAAEQQYAGDGQHTQPFPSVRHAVIDTVPVERVPDLLYMPAAKTLRYDLFLPTGGTDGAPPPVVLFLHGYGGSYTALPDFLVSLLAEGYAVAGVDFRRSPSNFSPDFQHDIKGAIRSLRANAAALGIDGERMGVFGSSNGGFTSLMMLVTNENDAFMEGSVGGNLGVSSRLQAGLVGYGASDYLYFGVDQRFDNANNEDLLRGMITGGDGENSPCAQMAGWYGAGKGLLMLRNYKEARDAAAAAGKLEEFLASDYVYTVDDAYLQKWFPWDLSGGLFRAGATATKGVYTYSHAELEHALELTAQASPITWVSPDDSPVGMYAGYGGIQNITHTQSVRTLQALSEAGVPGFLYSNTLGNYGKEAIVQAGMKRFLDEYLKQGPAGVKIVLRLGSEIAAVNYHSVHTAQTLKKLDGAYLLPLAFVAERLGADLDGVTEATEGVRPLDGALYATAAAVETLTGARVREWPGFDMVTISRSPAAERRGSPVAEPARFSDYGCYRGWSAEEYPGYVCKSVYVEVPAFHPGASASDPEHRYWNEGDMLRLAVDYVLPADADGNPVAGRFPVVLTCSRGGRFSETDLNGNGPVAIHLIRHGYAFMMIEMRGCGASEGINNSFSSIENRLDVKYIMENWTSRQPWYNGKFAMMGGSNRGLIQGATATTGVRGLVGITPVVSGMDFYYVNYMNGVSAALIGMNGGETVRLSGTACDAAAKPYAAWRAETAVKFVDSDPDGKIAYAAYVVQTKENRAFTACLMLPNMRRDSENPCLYGERTELTIAPMERSDAVRAAGVRTHQLAGYFDCNTANQIAMSNYWDAQGTVVLGPWDHRQTIRDDGDAARFPGCRFDIAADYLRWFDSCLKGIENGYDQAPRYLYYLIGAENGAQWRYADQIPPENAVWSTLYLAPEHAPAEVGEALRLHGAQSNNGKLLATLPAESAPADYRVDTGVALPPDFSGFNINSALDMRETVDARALTFTSAPAGAPFEIVGIPTIDLWVSSEETDDCDFIAYLEVVDPDGVSHYAARGMIRASHRETAENPYWDSTAGMRGRFHPSRSENVERALADGLREPVCLKFIFDTVALRVRPGQSLRLSVTCADVARCQHEMLYRYDGETQTYVLKEGDALPKITLYTGGDRASCICLPVLQDEANVINGAVTLSDGSYSGPGTLYLFETYWHLNYNGCWKRLPAGSGCTVRDSAAVFSDAGFRFLPEGPFRKNGVVQRYKGGEENTQPFPSVYHILLDTVPAGARASGLYLPTEKRLYIDFFRPERSSGSDPLLIWLHGFGGNTTAIDAFLSDAIGRGYAVAGIDLRTAPPCNSPDFYQDDKGAVRYLRKHARELGVDPDKFCAYGASMGGYTALMLAVSDGEPEIDGAVGGNTEVSGRTQGAIVGYPMTEWLYGGADQRKDLSGSPALLASMIAAGDGEFGPSSCAIDWTGPGKGWLMLRNYVAARAAAEAEGTLEEFLSKDYSFTVDAAYLARNFPPVNAGMFGYATTATPGTYTFRHAELEAALARSAMASPLYHIDGSAPPVLLFGGFGGPQNITNTQIMRAFSRFQDVGVKAFYVGNALGNYGREPSDVAMFRAYLDTYFPVK